MVQGVFNENDRRYPSIKIEAPEEWVIAFRLAKAGYGGGNPETILEMPVDIVMGLVQYEVFTAEYETQFIKINSPKEN